MVLVNVAVDTSSGQHLDSYRMRGLAGATVSHFGFGFLMRCEMGGHELVRSPEGVGMRMKGRVYCLYSIMVLGMG